ncbi:MAG: hypothetical protein JXP34_09900 [Planctomycetes bacterium]|nr:hypothetical protein [Planctomycetota bacterium]
MTDVIIHYHRPEKDYRDWILRAWGEGGEGAADVRPAGRDAFGLVFRIRAESFGGGDRIGFVPKRAGSETWDHPDRAWTPSLGVEVYIVSGDPALHLVPPDLTPRIVCAFLDGPRTVRIVLSRGIPARRLRRRRFSLRGPWGRVAASAVEGVPNDGGFIRRPTIEPGREIDPERDDIAAIQACARGYRPAPLLARDILLRYRVDDEELGPAEVDGGATELRVFAPTAREVAARLYETAEGGDAEPCPLARGANGVWRARLPGGRRYYTISVSGSDPRFRPDAELLDPYARAVTGPRGRAILVPRGAPAGEPIPIDPSDLVIYELHIRDFTVDPDSGIAATGRYAGLAEGGTRVPETDVATGLDHLRELGVNAVQIMPVAEFDKPEGFAYDWGYMPVLFGAPESSYASNPGEGSQCAELRDMIAALHRAGIAVILDAVVNHTAEEPPRVVRAMGGLAPGYYERLRDDGTRWNGSGCGNEFRSEAPVARKLIVDSLCRWVREYGVDGFRLDLMGLVDIATIDAARTALKAIRPDILLYGEPWTAGETPIRPTRKGDQRGRGFGVFDDEFRDAMLGGVFTRDPGFVQDGPGIEGVRTGIRGAVETFAQDPFEGIRYIACHDNRTLWDRIVATTEDDPAIGDDERRAMVRIAFTILLTSQGIPFIHAGDEFLRTKGGSENSYDRGDEVNRIRWRWKIDHRDIFDYVRGLIAIRRAHPIFRKRSRDEILRDVRFFDEHPAPEVPSGALGYEIRRGDSRDAWEAALVLVNPGAEPAIFTLPRGPWTVYADGRRASTRSLEGSVLADRVPVRPRAAAILAR